MDAVSMTEAREHFSEVMNRAVYGRERVVLTRRGKPLAAVVPIEDVEWLEELEDRLALEEAQLSLAEVKKHGTIPWGTITKELGLE